MTKILLSALVAGALGVLCYAVWRLWRDWNNVKEISGANLINLSGIGVGILILFLTLQANREDLFINLGTHNDETISLIKENRQDSLCQYNQVIVNELVELIAKITYEAQYGIGIPWECYADRGGDPIPIKNLQSAARYEQFRIDTGVLDAKMLLLLVHQEKAPVFVAYDKFVYSIHTIRQYCMNNPAYSEKDFREARENVSRSGSLLIHELSNLMLDCHQRVPAELMIRPPNL